MSRGYGSVWANKCVNPMARSCLTVCAALIVSSVFTRSARAGDWAAHLSDEYAVTSDIAYSTASGVDLRLDIYAPRGLAEPNTVVVYYPGGGWGAGTRERAVLRIIPYLEMGFSIVTVSYRGTRIAPAPAAVEDCRCALLWVVKNARQYGFDIGKIVLTGDSAGSHLALMSGMVSPSAGLDRQCPHATLPEPDTPVTQPKVAAIVNWSGATDVADLLAGPNARGFAIAWMGSQLNRAEIAERVSPLSYVRPGLPPILTLHGDADPVVPHAHASRLHERLSAHGVVNQLVTIRGGGHGGFTRSQNESNYAVIREFLGKLGLLRRRDLAP